MHHAITASNAKAMLQECCHFLNAALNIFFSLYWMIFYH
jgi:hypothetical protein